jgi:glucokinase
VEHIKTDHLVSKEYKNITLLLQKFLKDLEGTENYPVVGVIGIPGPIFKNTVSIIANLDWPVTKGEDVAKELNLKELVFLNDFVANGYGILSKITEGVDFERINNNEVDESGPIAMIGAGTGLGHGYLVKHSTGKYYHVFPSEGGHQDFAPQNDLECRYLNFLKNHYNIKHVSVERACSGPVIPVILQFFVENEKMQSEIFKTSEEIQKATPEDIIKYGLEKKCKVCEQVIELFVTIYGAAAGNMSLLLLPTGGVYLLGGLSVALEEYMIKNDTFRVNLF